MGFDGPQRATKPAEAPHACLDDSIPLRDGRGINGALGRMLLARVAEPLIVIDWSDLKADQSLHLLRASVPVGGRSLTLYEQVHPQRSLGNRQVQHQFLRRLKELLSAMADPVIVADSGFNLEAAVDRFEVYASLGFLDGCALH